MHIRSTLPAWAYKRTMPNINSDRYSLDLKPKIESSCCGPIATANIILYLAQHNCSRLIPLSYRLDENYLLSKLIETLGKEMDTTRSGTFSDGLTDGLEKYVKDRGYKIRIKSAGWPYSAKYKDEKVPYPEWIMQGVLGSYNSILWIGIYEYNSAKNYYKRQGGHAVTVAGFIRDWDELLVHDLRSSDSKPPDHYFLYKIKDKKLIHKDGEPVQASICFEISDDPLYNRKDNGKIEVLEGALSFEVTPK